MKLIWGWGDCPSHLGVTVLLGNSTDCVSVVLQLIQTLAQQFMGVLQMNKYIEYNLSIGSMRGQIKVPLWASFAILGYGYVRGTTAQCHNFSRGLYLRWSTSNIWCILDTVPYSRKLSRKKTFANWWNLRFSQRKLSQIVHFSHAKGHHAPKFHRETFASSHKTVKFVKVFSLQSFLLYSIQDGVPVTFWCILDTVSKMEYF